MESALRRSPLQSAVSPTPLSSGCVDNRWESARDKSKFGPFSVTPNNHNRFQRVPTHGVRSGTADLLYYNAGMSEVRILSAIEERGSASADQLLPLVYEELRKLAAAKLSREKPGQTLQATALVHKACLRLFGSDTAKQWSSRGHLFAAAAESMRRILTTVLREIFEHELHARCVQSTDGQLLLHPRAYYKLNRTPQDIRQPRG